MNGWTERRRRMLVIINLKILKEARKGVAPHEKWTAVYSCADKCRLISGQDFSDSRTGLL